MSSKGFGISKTEAAVIRNKLALRYSIESNCWEIFTTVHGSGHFRWYKISENTKKWYVDNFPELAVISNRQLAMQQAHANLVATATVGR
jgi:hypothetical protein